MSKKSKAAAAASSSASADTTQTAKDAEGIEVKIEVGAEVEDILEEMCGSFSGESRDAKLVRGYVDQIRERIGAASEKAAQNIDTMIKMKGGLANAVFEAVREAEERGIRWDETNTEPVNKVFRVEFQLGPYDRIKLGLLAKRAHMSPEQFLHGLLYSRFDEVCNSLFGKSHDPQSDDARIQCAYESLLTIIQTGMRDVGGVARFAFRPAAMA